MRQLNRFNMSPGQTYQRRYSHSHQQRNNICPGRKRNVLSDDDDKTENKTKDQNDNIPPPGCFFIVFHHVRMMAVIVSAGSSALIRLDEIAPPKEGTMGDQGTNLYVALVA